MKTAEQIELAYLAQRL